jgi:hypothetical protein
MNVTNWDLLKFKYEVLGVPLTEIATDANVSEAVLNFNSKDWVQLPLEELKGLELKEMKSLDDILTKLGDRTAAQTKVFSILKQKFLGPKYVELETILLHKAIEIASSIDGSDAKAASTLDRLASLLTELIDQNPSLTSEGSGEGKPDGKWEITFVETKKELED